MKNLILLALLALTIVTSAFATGENNVSNAVLNSFKLDFKDAKNVSWSSKTGFAKAAFILNNRKMEVFYDHKGDMIAQCENIVLDELPVNAKREFAKRYEGYTVTEAIKFDGITEQAYYIKAENQNQSVILKVGETEQLTVFKKGNRSNIN